MRTLIVGLCLALAACTHASHAPAPPKTTPGAGIDAAHLTAELDAYIASFGRNWGDAHKFSGFVLVTAHDQPLYAKGFGQATRPDGPTPDADTSFRIGSVTKQFTAAAVMRLVQTGKLKTTAKVRELLPDYRGPGGEVTVHQLLTHTSGIPNFTDAPTWREKRGKAATLAEVIAEFAARPLDFTPGSKFAYSNSNYIILGAIIARVSGTPYAEFLRSELFAPAGMTRTMVGDAPGLANRAEGYSTDGDKVVPADAFDMSWAYAAGAVRSTANDMARWHRALMGETILSAASKAELYTPDKGGYAYAWEIGEADGHQLIHHNGGIDGFTADFLRIPDLDLAVVVFSNNDSFDAGPIGKAAIHAALGHHLEPEVETTKVAFDAAAAAHLVGKWQVTAEIRKLAAAQGLTALLAKLETMELSIVNGHLMMKFVDDAARPLDPSAPGTYFSSSPEVELKVVSPRLIHVTIQKQLGLDYEPNP